MCIRIQRRISCVHQETWRQIDSLDSAQIKHIIFRSCEAYMKTDRTRLSIPCHGHILPNSASDLSMNDNEERLPHPSKQGNGVLAQVSGGAEELSNTPTSMPGTPTPPRVKPRQPVATLVEAALKGALARLQAADPEVRKGQPEGIHHLRTSMRRLRSELQTIANLLDRDWCTHLEEELKWLSSMLGNVRDVDILCQRLRAAIAKCSEGNNRQTDVACPDHMHMDRLKGLFEQLRRRHADNSNALREALEGERYTKLIEAIEKSIAHPALSEVTCQPCRKMLPPLAAGTWRRLKKKARKLGLADPDAAFHEVRKRAKRARYSAELIAPALGQRTRKQARRFIRLTTRIQDILGEHQDAIVAAAELERYLAEHSDDRALSLITHTLLEAQRRAMRRSREKFLDVWRKLDRKKTLRWIKPCQKAHL